MTDDDLKAAIREHDAAVQERQSCELIHYEELAFIIQRFCGGRIEFDPAEACSCFGRIDIQRTYRNGQIVYITRPAAEGAEETNPDAP